MKKLWAEFKAFIAKGNVVDLAIAVIIGNAFNKIVSSLVNDVIMPLISFAIGGADVSDWKWVITPAEYDATGNIVTAESALKYGSFIQTIIDFLIIALTLFIMFKVFTYSKNKLSKFGETIVEESHKLKEKSKKKKKKGEPEVVEQAEAVKVEEKTEGKEEKEEKPAEPETPVAPISSATKEDLMITLLQDIRDSLKTKN